MSKSGFGGSVKLTGESEYRQALQRCTQNLQSMSSALKSQTADFSANDKALKNTASKQKELTDSIKAQENELAKAKSQYASYSVALQTQTTRHNALNKEYKNAVLELDRIKKASGDTSNEFKKQAEVVDKLEKELIDSTENLNESKSAMASLKSEINNSTKTINTAKKELNDLGNEAEDSGKQAEKGAEGYTVLKGILANLGTQVIMNAISGLKKLGGAFVNVGKDAINSYANFEQLEGGVKKLFGDDAAKIVRENADKAFSSAGMSANQYMETVTNFSASLISGLHGDTKKAAQISDMAIRDMSDNANTFGTDMASIQYAYQGFAKQNYTMLDNLKLGYGGTKSEMARLVKESGILGDAGKDLTAKNLDQKVSFDQIIQAINVTQKRMGITGTTAKEAASTIEGSTNSMKAAWQNMLTGMADENANFEELASNFVSTLISEDGQGGVLGNLIPRITQVIQGMSNVISTMLPDLIQKIVPLIEQNLPVIIDAVKKGIETIVSVLPTIVDAIAPLIPQIVSMLISMLPQIIDAGIKILLSLIDGITEALPDLIKLLPKIIKDICKTLIANLDLIIDAGIQLLLALTEGIIEALPELIDYIPVIIDKVVMAITENLPKLIEAGIILLVKLTEGVIKSIPNLIAAIPKVISSLVKGIANYYKNIFNVGKELILKIRDGFSDNIEKFLSKVKELPGKIKDKISEGLKKIYDVGKELISGLWQGIKDKWNSLKNKVKDFGEGIVNKFKNVFGINSPSKVFKEQVGKYLAEGIGVGFEDEMNSVAKQMSAAIPTNFDTTITASGERGNAFAQSTYFDVVDAFKEALGQMSIELDDENMGKFIDKTVARTIYN